ncbi:hypothetical protein CLV28_1274 [Sediminihabitans luteus]|uniref:Uncharacterized protein n=1 Tax=Sediminihabitans luteus TaxID=1138585 RepID=A0A2M9CPI3_9CELL|nr:hypothetical protein [Sediminihabitans luteus]PJJ73793.1 hypothetical protein CLV28_1274 [Sediminihabitans luteus]GIJ00469.1 hypothetical protein Slu03_28460 [Sediminihabitans luteus]
MPPKARLALTWIVIGFLVYAVVKSPDKSAGVIKGIWDVIAMAFASIGTFFQTLIS